MYIHIWISCLLVFAVGISGQRSCSESLSCEQCTNTTDCNGSSCTWCVDSNSCVPNLLNFCPLNSRVTSSYNCPWPSTDGQSFDAEFAKHEIMDILCASNEGTKEGIETVLNAKLGQVQVSPLYTVHCPDRHLQILLPDVSGSGKSGLGQTNCTGFAVLSKLTETIFLVFSSNAEPGQVVASLRNILAIPQLASNKNVAGRIYPFYGSVFDKMWTDGLVTDYCSFLAKGVNFRTVVVGYSIGGGVASIASDVLATKILGEGSKQLQLYTFGQPRVGDVAYAKAHDVLVPRTYRIINHLDPVPLLPSRDFSLDPPIHTRHEVWYSHEMAGSADYIISHMAEDPKGRLSTVMVDNSDHQNYFGRNLLTCRLAKN